MTSPVPEQWQNPCNCSSIDLLSICRSVSVNHSKLIEAKAEESKVVASPLAALIGLLFLHQRCAERGHRQAAMAYQRTAKKINGVSDILGASALIDDAVGVPKDERARPQLPAFV